MTVLPEKSCLATGAGKFRYRPESRHPPISVHYYLPANLPEDAPVVFVMHGTKRDAELYRDVWSVAAELYRFILLCPRFRKGDYPRGTYHRGNVTDDAGRPNPKPDWTFGVVELLFDHARRATGNTSERYDIYGHSAGGQFVHRMAMLMPEARFKTAVAANTGWYTMPDENTDFPYGLRGTNSKRPLEAAFSRRLVLLLGENDTNPEDPFLRTTEEAMLQGPTRLERGHAFYEASRKRAGELDAHFAWELATIPGATHLDRHMMPVAARTMFGLGEVGL